MKKTTTIQQPEDDNRIYNRYGELAKLAIELSGRSPSMVYAVLRGKVTSRPVSRAIAEARRRLRARKGVA